jgi:hypothetical protein
MRQILLILTVFASVLVYYPGNSWGQEAPSQTETLRQLGEQFVDSLKDDDFVAYAQCWITWRMAYKTGVKADAPESMLKRHRYFMLERDRELTKLFPCLRQRLLDLSSELSQIKLESISGPLKEDEDTHVLIANPLVVCVRVDPETVVKWSMLGVRINAEWYFSGTPEPEETIIRREKSEVLDLETGQPSEWQPLLLPKKPCQNRGEKERLP